MTIKDLMKKIKLYKAKEIKMTQKFRPFKIMLREIKVGATIKIEFVVKEKVQIKEEGVEDKITVAEIGTIIKIKIGIKIEENKIESPAKRWKERIISSILKATSGCII